MRGRTPFRWWIVASGLAAATVCLLLSVGQTVGSLIGIVLIVLGSVLAGLLEILKLRREDVDLHHVSTRQVAHNLIIVRYPWRAQSVHHFEGEPGRVRIVDGEPPWSLIVVGFMAIAIWAVILVLSPPQLVHDLARAVEAGAGAGTDITSR